MSFGPVVDWIIAIIVIVVLGFLAKHLLRFLSWVEQSEIARQKAEDEAERKASAARAVSAAPRQEPEGVPAEHIAAIAAAVAAFGFRVIHIDDQAGHAWASEGRWMHQTSHQVSRGV